VLLFSNFSVAAQYGGWPGFSQRFFSFLTFLLLFAQYGGGAIYNDGTLTVKYGNFTGNSADDVCILAPTASALAAKYCPLACYIPARDIEGFGC
jgi:hypothetical protein